MDYLMIVCCHHYYNYYSVSVVVGMNHSIDIEQVTATDMCDRILKSTNIMVHGNATIIKQKG